MRVFTPTTPDPAATNRHYEKSDSTRLTLIESARRLFGSRSYADVSLAEIVEASGLTKGALSHHFPGGKRDLMEAVYEQVEAEFTANVAAGVMPRLTAGDVDALTIMEEALSVTLEASLDPELQQIVLIDSPQSSAGTAGVRSPTNTASRWSRPFSTPPPSRA